MSEGGSGWVLSVFFRWYYWRACRVSIDRGTFCKKVISTKSRPLHTDWFRYETSVYTSIFDSEHLFQHIDTVRYTKYFTLLLPTQDKHVNTTSHPKPQILPIRLPYPTILTPSNPHTKFPGLTPAYYIHALQSPVFGITRTGSAGRETSR